MLPVVSTRRLKITYRAHTVFLLGSAALDGTSPVAPVKEQMNAYRESLENSAWCITRNINVS